jgi:predicted membrane-bound spermidine synthase
MKKSVKPSAPPLLSKKLRRYLYLTAAVTGAAIMVVEILGAKMLSPFVGMSHFVWTAQIAVTMVALACGYYVGGWLVDHFQKLHHLYLALLIAAGYLVLTVLICEPVANWCLDFNLAVGTLLASTVLFFVPLALLAITGPFLVRIVTSSVNGVGGNVGRLTSIGTLGSFAGTLCIGYLMLPLLPNSISMYLTAAVLVIICTGYVIFFSRKPVMMVLTVGLIGVIGLLAGNKSARDYTFFQERFNGNSHFGQVQVLDRRDGRLRLFFNDNLTQNTYDPVVKKSLSAFTYALAGLARAYTGAINDVLCIGMGVGIVPMEFAGQGAKVDVVEINPAVIPVAVQFFNFEPERLRVTIDDGRHFLNRCRQHYDVIVLDAFLGDSSPSHLMTREAFASIALVMRPGGTLVINTFCNLESGQDFFAASLEKTLKSVFAGVRLHNDDGQIYFVATKRNNPKFVRNPESDQIHPAVRSRVETAFTTVINTPLENGLILTDDFNPVEFHDAGNREILRRRFAQNAKEL